MAWSQTTKVLFNQQGQVVQTEKEATFYIEFSARNGHLVPYEKRYLNKQLIESGTVLQDLKTRQGKCSTYFKTGHVKLTQEFNKGVATGLAVSYLPTGSVNYEFILPVNTKSNIAGSFRKYLQGYDSVGVQTAKNGNGYIKIYDDTLNVREEGNIKDSLMTGIWIGRYPDGKIYFRETYDSGKLIQGISYDLSGSEYRYKTVKEDPLPVIGLNAFHYFINQNFKASSAGAKPKGQTFLGFTVQIDGSLKDIKIVKGLDEYTNKELLRILKKSPEWKPALLRGQPLQVPYILPISFN